MKLERLLNVTAALLETRRPLTAEDIRKRIPGYPDRDDAFRRAFERDKDDLREMGIPLEVVPVDGTNPPISGYVIPPDRYYLADPGLDPDELAALQMAAVMIRLGDSDADELDAVRKLGGGHPAHVDHRRLGRRIGDGAPAGLQPGDRAHIENIAPAPLDHAWQKGLGDEKGAAQIDRDLPVEMRP